MLKSSKKIIDMDKFNSYFIEKNKEYLILAEQLAKEDFDILDRPWKASISIQTDDDFGVEFDVHLIEDASSSYTENSVIVSKTKKELKELIKLVLDSIKLTRCYGREDVYRRVIKDHIGIVNESLKKNLDYIDTGGGNHWIQISINKRMTNLVKKGIK